jgi:hypothetical protein
MGGLDFFSLVQQAVAALLNTYEPEFLRYSQTMFLYLATIMIAYTGIELLFTSAAPNDKMWTFVKLMLFISFGYSLVFFYMTPIPGAGVSFTHLMSVRSGKSTNTSTRCSMRSWRPGPGKSSAR